MAKKKSSDITQNGPLKFSDLQTLNYYNQLYGSSIVPVTEDDISQYLQERGMPDETAGIMRATAGINEMGDRPVSTPIAQNSGGEDFWGNSYFDPDIAVGGFDINRLSDIRAENQPWYSKLINGIGKAGVLAGTTALESAGLLYGVGQGVYNAATNDEEETGMGGGSAFLHGLWDNPITNALQNINEFSEEWMPNYYTQDETENPWGNIFTANFLGDKLLKNLGFMVGAFYGGIPASSAIGKAGTSYVKAVRAASLAERTGAAKAGLTVAEQGKITAQGLDKVRNAARTTRAISQTIGSLGSALNEGAIEAINNSKDWANLAKQQEDARYQQELEEELAKIELGLGNTEVAESAKIQKRVELAQKHQKYLQEIELGRARVGNADLLLNIPVLMASNMYQLSRLYTRGFDSTRRQLGSFWNGHKLSGSLENGTLTSNRTWKKGLTSALLKSNTEGLEEYLQRAASDGAGEAVADSISRFMEAGTSGHAEENVQDYIAGFGKAVADNLGDPNAWEEYMIGAVSSMFGMPVFGSQTKNAYLGKNSGVFGMAGGLYGEYQDYMEKKEHEEQIARYLNQRVKDPKFKALYDNLKIQEDYDRWLREQIELGDKSKYKDLELEKFYQDLNAAASSGHLEEFKVMVGYNQDYDDEELNHIMEETTRRITPEQQREQDEQRKVFLTSAMEQIQNKPFQTQNMFDDFVAYQKELYEVDQRLQADEDGSQPYKEKLEGPFIDCNGQMNVTDPDKMRKILDRNRKNLLQGINDYLKIRNDIDIETDGNLDDKQIALLTQMKGKILDYEKRSAEMADDLISNLGDVKDRQQLWKDKLTQKQEAAQKEYNNAKQHLESVKEGKYSKDYKEQVEKTYQAAEKKLNEAKTATRAADNAMRLLDMLTEEKDTTALERAAEAKGEGRGFFSRLGARFQRGQKRTVNSDEAQAILANPQNAMSLIRIVNSWASDLNNKTRQQLTQEIVDLSTLANQKLAYNKKVREFLEDPDKINEAYQQAQDKISQKEIDNKSEELSLRIKGARSMSELDGIMKEAHNTNPDIARAAIQKAKQTGDESTKKFLDDYEKGTNFFGTFAQQAQKLGDAVRAGVMETAVSAWEEALTNGVDVYDRFVQNLNDAVTDLNADPNPASKQTATGLKQVLKDLEAGASSVKTNKKTKKTTTTKKSGDTNPDAESDEDDAASLEALAKLRKKRTEAESKSDEGDASDPFRGDKYATITWDIRAEIGKSGKNGVFTITNIAGLSEVLQDEITKYNEEHPEKPITEDTIVGILQGLVDDYLNEDDTNLNEDDLKDDGTDLGEENDGSERAERMHENLRVSFKSDHPTEFRFNVDYRIPYAPEGKVLQAVQKLLKNLKAYQFVDKNYLGYLAREMGGHPTIHLLRSTDETINSDRTNPITFLAVKWDSKAEHAVRKHGFNGSMKVSLSEEVKPVTINGEQYQIVGVMTLNSGTDSKVSEAFASLQGALNQELNPQIEDARQNGQQFVVSQLSTQVNSINTGRLERRNSEKDSEEKVGLYEFMTSQQDNPERRTSTEWESGSDFYFGVVANGLLNTNEDEDTRALFEEPNEIWMEKNNGMIVLFLPKPDGRLYPTRCSRRTVREWVDANADGRTGWELMSAVINGDVKNEYLGNILGYLRNIYDSEAAIGDRMKAKMMLSKYFIFGKQSPIHFNDNEVSLGFEGREYDLTSDDFEEFVSKFFDTLSQENIMFTIPTQSFENVSGRDIISSGILEVGLRNFYNFNANFTIFPIDKDGNHIVIKTEPEREGHFTGGNNIRANAVEFDFGDGIKTYIIESDGTVTLGGSPVSADKQNIVGMAMQAQQGTIPQMKIELLNARFSKSTEVKKFVADGITGFDDIYIIHAEEDWVYDRRKGDHNARLYKLGSEEGIKLKKDFNQAVTNFTMQAENIEAIKKLREASKVTPVADEIPTSTVTPRISTSPIPGDEVVQEKQFAGKALEELNDRGTKLEAYLTKNKTSSLVKKVFAALQGAEEAGQAIDQQRVLEILQSDKTNREKLQEALDEINGCHK